MADTHDLAELVRQQKAAPPIIGSRARAAQRRLTEAAAKLNNYLTPAGQNGAEWKKYLRFNDLLAACKADKPLTEAAIDALAVVLHRFRGNHAGLELPVFQDAASALAAYLPIAREQLQPATPTEVEQKLEQLAARLDRLTDPPAPDDLSEIGRIVCWLDETGRCPELAAQIRGRLSQPNLHVLATQEVISSGSLRHIEDQQPRPVRDVILGTQIVGAGRTTGWARTRLLPDPNRALFETRVVALNQSQTVGYNGPARIGSASTTRISGAKQFYLDATGFHVWKATSSADSRSQIRGVWSNKRCLADRLVRRVAGKRVAQQKRSAERVASRHAEAQLNARLDREANAQLGRAHADFMARFRNPLVRVGQWPRELRLSSTAEQFRLIALHDGGPCLAAPTAPPSLPENAALAVQFHESLVNNYGQGLLAGRTVRQEELDRLSRDFFGRRPAELARDEAKGPWAISFGGHEPLVLRIAGGRVSFTLRGRRFASSLRTIETPLDLTAHYRLLRENNAAKAVREGELEVYPAGFSPGGRRRMSLRQSRDASYLRHRFDDFFKPEITSQGLVLPGQWGRAGQMELVELNADRGWLTLAWRPATTESPTTQRLP